MNLSEVIEKLVVIQNRQIESSRLPYRDYSQNIHIATKRGVLLVGSRGVGKTTLLIHQAQKNNMLYMSADHPNLADISLYDLGEAAFVEGFQGLIIDEAHNAKDWGIHLKSLYDSFPSKKIWASDSNSMILRLNSADLTRRFPLTYLPFLSFREFIHLSVGVLLPPFDPFNAPLESFANVVRQVNVMGLFKTYLQCGSRPFFLEGDYTQKLLAIIEKSIFFDVPFFVSSVSENHLRLMKAVVATLAHSAIPTLNIDRLATDWSVGKEKVYDLLDVMQHIGVLHIVRYKSDQKASGKGAKILFADPTMYHALDGQLGNIRESFVASVFQQMQKPIYACKNEISGDFEIEGRIIEIGGRHKSLKQANIVFKDDIELPGKQTLPLWSLGMMY